MSDWTHDEAVFITDDEMSEFVAWMRLEAPPRTPDSITWREALRRGMRREVSMGKLLLGIAIGSGAMIGLAYYLVRKPY